MSLILVATVGGVLLERCVGARRTVVWGHAGAERGTRPATVRGPPTAVFDRPLCQTRETAVEARPTRGRRRPRQRARRRPGPRTAPPPPGRPPRSPPRRDPGPRGRSPACPAPRRPLTSP